MMSGIMGSVIGTLNPTIGGDPFSLKSAMQEVSSARNLQAGAIENNSDNFSSMASMVGAISSQPRMDFEKTDIPNMLRQNGIDPKGISMNPFGRTVLTNRLQNRFGDVENSTAMSILSEFNKNLNSFQIDMAKSIAKSINSSENTLAALLR